MTEMIAQGMGQRGRGEGRAVEGVKTRVAIEINSRHADPYFFGFPVTFRRGASYRTEWMQFFFGERVIRGAWREARQPTRAHRSRQEPTAAAAAAAASGLARLARSGT